MQRVKITKQTKSYRIGDVVVMDNNEAFGLIDSGKAILTKDMTRQDYKVKTLDEEQANGKPTQLRPYRFSVGKGKSRNRK